MKFHIELRRTQSVEIVVEAASKEEARKAAEAEDIDSWSLHDDDEVSVFAARDDAKAEYGVLDGRIVELSEMPPPPAPDEDPDDPAVMRRIAEELERRNSSRGSDRARYLFQQASIAESRADYIAGRIRP